MLNRTFRRVALLVLPLFAAAGCASYEWRKDGADAAESRALLERCSLKARTEAARRIQTLAPAPNIAVDRQGRVIAVQPHNRDGERFLLEQDLIRRCMNEAGYVLRPAEQGGPR
jgi:hypothetical protein